MTNIFNEYYSFSTLNAIKWGKEYKTKNLYALRDHKSFSAVLLDIKLCIFFFQFAIKFDLR